MECCFPSSFSSVKPNNGFQTFNCKPSFNSICNRQRQSSRKVLAKLFHKIIIRHVNFPSVSARELRVFFFSNCLFVCINFRAQDSAYLIESTNIWSREKKIKNIFYLHVITAISKEEGTRWFVKLLQKTWFNSVFEQFITILIIPIYVQCTLYIYKVLRKK